jgi:hypothetical protein
MQRQTHRHTPRHTFATRRVTYPWWQAEAPFLLLLASAVAATLFVLDQGSGWHTALLAALVVLSVPGAAIEGMVGLARLAVRLRGEER